MNIELLDKAIPRDRFAESVGSCYTDAECGNCGVSILDKEKCMDTDHVVVCMECFNDVVKNPECQLLIEQWAEWDKEGMFI